MKLVAKDVYRNEYSVSKSELLWRPSVYGILKKDDTILLSPQFRSGSYDLPGGGVNIDESLEEALVREFYEETGLVVKMGRQVGAGDNLFRSSFSKNPKVYHSILIFFECEYVSGDISTDNFDGIENQYMNKAEWVKIQKLKDIQVASSFDWRDVVLPLLQGGA